MNRFTTATLALAFLLSTSLLVGVKSAQAAVQVVTFEGLADREPILNFYDGGFGGFGSGPGPDFDITFGPEALALIDADAGGAGNFANEPSADTIAFWLVGDDLVMNALSGFTTGFSFFYTSATAATITVYDGPNATGNVLGVVNLVAQHTSCGATGDPSGTFACWDPVGVSFAGTAFSVSFGGTANYTGFDNITPGADTPGGGEEPAPAAVDIDVKPGSDLNPLNLNGNGVVPVGLFGSAAVDVSAIDVSTVRMGVDGSEAEPVREGEIDDLNGDGVDDIVFHFREGDSRHPSRHAR